MRSHDVVDVLARVGDVVTAPTALLPRELSALLAPVLAHTGLVLLAADADGGQLQSEGLARPQDAVSALELDQLRRITLAPGTTCRGELTVSGRPRPALHVLARNGALLILLEPSPAAGDELVLRVWDIVALQVQAVADVAPPDYLQRARASSGIRMEALTELADEYSTTLESVLATLRAPHLDDATARERATMAAAEGMVHLRTASDRVRTFTEEPVTTAFARLREDLRPLLRYRDIQMQFVEPPVDGRPLPSEVAHGARAVVRGAILALVDAIGVSRVRVQWDCDGTNLLVNVRDDGPGDLDDASTLLQLVRQRVHALNGRLTVEPTAGWGTEMAIALPLDPPHPHAASPVVAGLRPREMQVMELMATGLRNRDIATELGISENTVKFHVSRILRTLGAGSRAGAVSMLLSARNG